MTPEHEPVSMSPQWSPVVKTGKTPGDLLILAQLTSGPQWSPVVKTGKTG